MCFVPTVWLMISSACFTMCSDIWLLIKFDCQIWNNNDTFPPVRISKSSYCLAYFCFQLQSDGEQCCERENMWIILVLLKSFIFKPKWPMTKQFYWNSILHLSLISFLISSSLLWKCNFIVHINLWPNKTDGRADMGGGGDRDLCMRLLL